MEQSSIPSKVIRVISAATDGACSGNPGPGGWGAIIKFDDGSEEELGGHERDTTNNRMELKAALEVFKRLKQLPRHPNIKIKTDSKYLIDGLNLWMKGWKKKNWLTASNKPVLNQDLWKALDNEKLVDVSLIFVKGHDGDPDNEKADKIAVKFSKNNADRKEAKTIENKSQLNKYLEAKTDNYNNATPKLNKLLSRLEMSNLLAEKGYYISTSELSELLEIPIEDLNLKKDLFQWRNWTLERVDNEFWKLNFTEENCTDNS